MNQKTAITITLAIFLALICALLMFKTNRQNLPQNEVLNNEHSQIMLQEEETNSEITEENTNFVDHTNNINQTPKSIEKIFPIEEQKISETPNTENIVHEASVVEEVPDYGITRDGDGNIIITREFGKKSAIKYSFRNYGTIDKISIK